MALDDTCACYGKSLPRLLRAALMALLHAGPQHGYAIVQHLASLRFFAADPPDAAGVYRTLKSMESKGLLAASWDMREPGPPRRVFSLTPEGRACLAKWQETLTAYQAGLGEVLALVGSTTRSAPRETGHHHGSSTPRRPVTGAMARGRRTTERQRTT